MIFDRYLLREVATPFLGISAALIVLFVTYSLTRYLSDATDGVLLADAVFLLTLLKGLIALETLLPVALYIALMVALGRLYSDWEVTAFKASGISEGRIIVPVLFLAGVISVGIAAISLWVRPWAYDQLYEIQADAEAFNDLDLLQAGRFHFDDERDRVIFMNARGEEGLRGLFVRSQQGQDLQVISADRGTFTAFATPDRHRLDLRDAQVFRQAGDGEDLLGYFKEFTLWLPTAIRDPVGPKPKRMSNPELRSSDTPDARAELQWRQSTAVSALLLALLAVPLSRTSPRRGRYAKVMLAVVLYALYYNLIGVARTGVEQQATATLWWAPGLLLVIVAGGFFFGRRRLT
ncbi:MAG: LPS export ABC transporter permease LptF [Pseudomonadales bacterium]